MLLTVFDFGDCSIDICLFVLYCVVCFVCVTCFFSDKFHVRLLYDRICGPTKWYVCMYVRTYVHMYVHICMYVRMYVHTYVCTYVYMYVCMYVCMYYVCMYYVCMFYVRMYKRKLLNLLIIRRILTGKPWLSVGRQHVYAHFLKCTLGNGIGKLYSTGCEGLTIWVGLIMFRKLGTGSKERISECIPLQIGPLKTGTNCLQTR